MESNKFRSDCEWDLAELLERFDNSNIASIMVTIPASSDTVESEGQLKMLCWILYVKLCRTLAVITKKNIRKKFDF